jgi:hypothetical protein
MHLLLQFSDFQSKMHDGRTGRAKARYLPPHLYLFPVVPRRFHRARRATPSTSIEFSLLPLFPDSEKRIQKAALIARTSATENIGNTLKAFAGIREQTGNRTGNTGNN